MQKRAGWTWQMVNSREPWLTGCEPPGDYTAPGEQADWPGPALETYQVAGLFGAAF